MGQDIPCSFYDVSWLAVRGGDAGEVARVLGLSDPVPVSWHQGLSAVLDDFWDFDADVTAQFSRLYLPPRLDGWLLAIGGWLGGDSDERIASIAEHCRRLSEIHGAAHAFTSQGRLGYYSWTLAEAGVLQRLYAWDGETLMDAGTPSGREARLVRAYMEGRERAAPGELLVMTLAAAFSLDIRSLGPATHTEGEGFLFKTDVGREHGVPSRPLWDDAG